MWKPTTNGLICTGDGIAQAYNVESHYEKLARALSAELGIG